MSVYRSNGQHGGGKEQKFQKVLAQHLILKVKMKLKLIFAEKSVLGIYLDVCTCVLVNTKKMKLKGFVLCPNSTPCISVLHLSIMVLVI